MFAMATQTLEMDTHQNSIREKFEKSKPRRRHQQSCASIMGAKTAYSPLSVAKQVNRMLDVGLLKHEPVWYQPVLNTPPMTDFSRKNAQAHQPRSWNRPSDLREIQPIQRGMDVHIRTKFYKEHPWELARPRIVVEDDGADYVRQDWSKMEQYGKPLDGESVVQRTLYLMQEMKPPTERYAAIHGFDETQARGRPCESLPEYGNIQEANKEVDNILQTWDEITTELDKLLNHRQALRNELKALMARKPEQSQVKEFRDRIKFLGNQIHRLQRKTRKMLKLSPEVAYLQACSEFYLLRQQEEVETRVAVEQARVFKRQMGPSVNEKEIIKEQHTLQEWRATAHRHHTMMVDAKRGGKDDGNVDRMGLEAASERQGFLSLDNAPEEDEDEDKDEDAED